MVNNRKTVERVHILPRKEISSLSSSHRKVELTIGVWNFIMTFFGPNRDSDGNPIKEVYSL